MSRPAQQSSRGEALAYSPSPFRDVNASSRAAEHAVALERAAFDAKRVVDLVTAGGLLIVGSPLCLLVGLAIKLEDGGPILFRQRRVGRGGVPFVLYKLRSMRVDAEAESGPRWAAIDDARVTRIGKWIRALRIDELPQAWNVLRGDMSFVGPRPERVEFVQMLSERIPGYDRRHLLRPGITGWAQVNQPHSGTVEEARLKHAYDLHYLERHSLRLDVRILLRTAKLILFGWGGGEHPRR